MVPATQKRLDYLAKHHPAMYLALTVHRTHRNEMITFDRHEYLRDFILDKSPYIVCRKATQGGYTEFMEIMALSKAISGRGVFYVMPTEKLISRFVHNRIDKSISFTKYYRDRVGDAGKKGAESVSLKHIGKGVISFVPSNSSSGFTEFPADDLIIDELDECDQSNLAMAVERLSASRDPRIIKVGNPKVVGFGIDKEYSDSDKKTWMIKCRCGEWLSPDFFAHVVEEVEKNEWVIRDPDWDGETDKDIRLFCHKCGKPINRFSPGQWVKQDQASHISGYHVSKLFSTNMRIADLVDRFDKGLRDDTKLQRFYNGDLGMAFTSTGAKMNAEMINECRGEYSMPSSSTTPCVIGADVGSVIHTVVAEILPNNKLRTIFIGTVSDEADIKELCKVYNVKAGVIDALPEKRMSKRLANTIRGMFMCYYGDVKTESVNLEHRIVTVDRTASLDGVKEAFLLNDIILPRNADKLAPIRPDGTSELYYELCASTRVYNESRNRYEWVEGGLPDHYFHAFNYLLIARRILSQAN